MKTLRFSLFLLFLCCSLNFLHAQNLILNPGLEIQDTSTSVNIIFSGDSFIIHHVLGWYNPGFTTTDFFNSDGKHTDFGSYYFSKEVKAHGENCFSGIYIENSKWKEYVGVDFTQALVADQNYRLEFYTCISRKARLGMTTLEINCWDTSRIYIGGEHGVPLHSPKYPNIIINNTAQVGMVDKWVKVGVDFTAIGGEKSFVLGYMLDVFRTVFMPSTLYNRNNDAYSYYFFDDFSLVPISGPPIPRMTNSRPIIYFDVDKAVIKPEFYAPLDEVVLRMKGDATLKIELDGFTDIDGTNPDNQTLSERRAEAVKAYLVAHGADGSRITTKGFAEAHPVGEDKGLNRRVEFVYSH